MFTKAVEYALRAVAHLAHESPEARTTEQIAEATKVDSLTYLSKVLQNLRRQGILRSIRGHGGGMTLARQPSELTILEVVNAVEPIQRLKTCPLGLVSHGVRLCPLHRRIDNALALVEEAFGGTTLAEVLAEKTDSPPLCEGLLRPDPVA
ncbi:MAG: Rrf2 family transcriptional regulator [Verrucomicrobiales bacterium]|nr:Rrf2 family transcriptional regulator [Verrucomicrobiae bacterium]MCP5552855.1 Rrf2 family transcriptional regulator [Akkermansiaceae bacterium]